MTKKVKEKTQGPGKKKSAKPKGKVGATAVDRFGYSVFFSERCMNRVIAFDPDTNSATVVAGNGSGTDDEHQLRDPYGLASSQDGRLFVSDKRNNRVCKIVAGKLEMLAVKDLDGHRDLVRPGRRERPAAPTGLYAEPDGSLLVTYSEDDTIYRVRPNGELELVLGIPPNRHYMFSGCKEMYSPDEVRNAPINMPVAVVGRSDGTIFFIERGYQTVRGFHPKRGIWSVFPLSMGRKFIKTRKVPDRLSILEYHPARPSALAVDSSETLYLADPWHRSVWRVDEVSGTLLKVCETPEDESREGGPSAIAFGPDGALWVMDYGTGLLLAFAPQRDGRWEDLKIRVPTAYQKIDHPPLEGSGLTCIKKKLLCIHQ